MLWDYSARIKKICSVARGRSTPGSFLYPTAMGFGICRTACKQQRIVGGFDAGRQDERVEIDVPARAIHL